MQTAHLCAGLRIKENKEVYEGEVTELTPEETEAPGGGFQKAISHVVIGLRTVRRGRTPWSQGFFFFEPYLGQDALCKSKHTERQSQAQRASAAAALEPGFVSPIAG